MAFGTNYTQNFSNIVPVSTAVDRLDGKYHLVIHAKGGHLLLDATRMRTVGGGDRPSWLVILIVYPASRTILMQRFRLF